MVFFFSMAKEVREFMKILMVNKFLFPKGGAETYMLRLGESLTALGHRVEYFGMDHPDRTVCNSWNLYTTPMDFHQCNLMEKVSYLTRIIYSREAKKKMHRLLTLFQPDVVHINNFNFQLTPSILLAAEEYRNREKRPLKIVYTAHDFQLICPNHLLFDPAQHQICERCLEDKTPVHCLKNKCIHGFRARSMMGVLEYHYWNRRDVYRILDCILCPSVFMKRKLDGNPTLAERTVFLRNFVSAPPEGTVKKENYILYFGRYSEEKGIRALVNACQNLPDIPFVFAGGGPLENVLADVPNIRNVGFLHGEELQRVIRNARFSVCLSQCHDNCPFSVMESIMAGTPVLGSPNGGIPELIEEGRTGWICQAEEKQLIQALTRIWNSTEPEDFHSACLKTRFADLPDYVEKLMQIYQEGLPHGRDN